MHIMEEDQHYFYGVFAQNKAVVYDDWASVVKASEHCRDFSVRVFDCYDDAEAYALYMFKSEMQPSCIAPASLTLNVPTSFADLTMTDDYKEKWSKIHLAV